MQKKKTNLSNLGLQWFNLYNKSTTSEEKTKPFATNLVGGLISTTSIYLFHSHNWDILLIIKPNQHFEQYTRQHFNQEQIMHWKTALNLFHDWNKRNDDHFAQIQWNTNMIEESYQYRSACCRLLHISPLNQAALLLSLRNRDHQVCKMFPLNQHHLLHLNKTPSYLVFFSNLPVLSLYNSTQRLEIHKMLTEIADITTTIQETQTHLGIKPSAAPLI